VGENGSRNLAGASTGTPGDAKCVTEVIGEGGWSKIKKLRVELSLNLVS